MLKSLIIVVVNILSWDKMIKGQDFRLGERYRCRGLAVTSGSKQWSIDFGV